MREASLRRPPQPPLQPATAPCDNFHVCRERPLYGRRELFAGALQALGVVDANVARSAPLSAASAEQLRCAGCSLRTVAHDCAPPQPLSEQGSERSSVVCQNSSGANAEQQGKSASLAATLSRALHSLARALARLDCWTSRNACHVVAAGGCAVKVQSRACEPCMAPQPRARVLLINGVSGVGKSALAQAVARACLGLTGCARPGLAGLCGDALWASAFYVDLQHSSTVDAMSLCLCQAFGLVQLRTDPRLPIAWLASQNSRSSATLGVLLDNADSMAQDDLAMMLRLLLRAHERLQVVITRRDAAALDQAFVPILVPPLCQVRPRTHYSVAHNAAMT